MRAEQMLSTAAELPSGWEKIHVSRSQKFRIDWERVDGKQTVFFVKIGSC